MNVSRNFLLIGVVYLLIGMAFGSYMGASQDHSLTPVHAHINLLGFTLMAVFAGIYKMFPAMAASPLAGYHFWLHQVGTLVMLTALFVMLTNLVAAETIGLVFPLAELTLIGGTAIFGWNAFVRAK